MGMFDIQLQSSSPDRSGPDGAAHDGLAQAASMLGKPYRYGGSTPRGFDCSGLDDAAYEAAGATLVGFARANGHRVYADPGRIAR